MTLEDLARAAVGGDASALSRLATELSPMVFRLCLRLLGDPRDAEDAVQDVLVKVITHLGSFEGRSALTTWVHRIAVRHVLEARKSRAELRALDVEELAALLEQGLAFGAAHPPARRDPETRLLSREVRLTCTQGMLLLLSREERLAVVLVDVLAFDAAEAAHIAEISHATMRQRLSRGRARLAGFLRARCGLASDEAACRCDRQVTARRALGLRVDRLRFSAFTPEGSAGQVDATKVAAASEELRDAGTVVGVYRRDADVVAPATLHERLRRALPILLG